MFRGTTLGGALTLTILIVACGGSGSKESKELPPGVTTLAAEQTTTAPASGGAWERYERKNFTVEIPESWTAVGLDEDAPAEAFEALPADAREALQSGDFFYALDASEEATKRYTEGKLAGSFSIGQLNQPATSWKRFVDVNSTPPDGAENYRASVVTLPAGRALMRTFNRTGAPLNQPTSTIQYALLPTPELAIVLTMETAPDLLGHELGVFEEMAQRFRYTP